MSCHDSSLRRYRSVGLGLIRRRRNFGPIWRKDTSSSFNILLRNATKIDRWSACRSEIKKAQDIILYKFMTK